MSEPAGVKATAIAVVGTIAPRKEPRRNHPFDTLAGKSHSTPVPSAVRSACRAAFAKRIAALEDIADGAALKRVEVPLLAVLEYASCPSCGDALQAIPRSSKAGRVSFEGYESVSASERTRAIEILAKHGMSENVSKDDVRGRLTETIACIRANVPAEMAIALLVDLQAIWKL